MVYVEKSRTLKRITFLTTITRQSIWLKYTIKKVINLKADLFQTEHTHLFSVSNTGLLFLIPSNKGKFENNQEKGCSWIPASFSRIDFCFNFAGQARKKQLGMYGINLKGDQYI